MVKEVYLIFKTHLDIGFTDYAENVVKSYLENYIPSAIKRGYELKNTDTPFKWSTGSWIINEALKCDSDGIVKKAIEDGIINWHGLPFTSFTESMSEHLLDYGLSISDRLDERFGKVTKTAKMSDVPGHTKAMIKQLKKHGIEFLHIGINWAYYLPDVPPLFRWKNGDDEVVVMYQQTYGETMEFGEFALEFGFTGDNLGPQSGEEIAEQYKLLQKKYPEAKIIASTFDEFWERLKEVRDSLPVVESEIGDLWIHNVGTDPKKVSLYRELLRHIEDNGINADISDNLLVVPEHTWGLSGFKFPNFIDYLRKDFEKIKDDPRKRAYEKSWEEKRAYIDKAQKVMGTNYIYDVTKPDLSDFCEIEIPELDFEISWQLFGREDYDRYMNLCILPQRHFHYGTVIDNVKFLLPDYETGIFTAQAKRAYQNGNKTIILMEFEKEVASREGLPYMYVELEDNKTELKWFDMKENRLPNAFWIKFKGYDEKGWQISKLGQWIDAEGVIGSPLIAATDKGVRNREVEIESLDAILVAPYGRRLLDFEKNPSDQDMYFNLYNNIWNCNHPMWYSDDSRFRFIIKKL